MRGNISIIEKLFVVQLFTVFLIALNAEPYKPYPIIFVHGMGSNAGAWGLEYSEDNWIKEIEDDGTLDHFLDYMNTYVDAWEAVDTTYTIPTDDAYPNKTFLEVINFDYNRGSIE